MMSETMTLPTLSDPRTFLAEMIARDREAFVRLCLSEFDSAEDMAAQLSEAGYEMSDKRAQRIRNRTAGRIYAAERKAVRFTLKRRVVLRRADAVLREAEALERRAAELRASIR